MRRRAHRRPTRKRNKRSVSAASKRKKKPARTIRWRKTRPLARKPARPCGGRWPACNPVRASHASTSAVKPSFSRTRISSRRSAACNATSRQTATESSFPGSVRGAPAPRFLRIDHERAQNLHPIAVTQRRVERHESAVDPHTVSLEVDFREVGEHPARFDRLLHRRSVVDLKRVAHLPFGPRVDDLDPELARAHLACTASARRTNASTTVFAM